MNTPEKLHVWSLIDPSKPLKLAELVQRVEQLLLDESLSLSGLPLAQLFNKPDQSHIRALQIAVLKDWRCLLNPTQFVVLASFLFKEKEISLNEVGRLLCSVSESERKLLDGSRKEAVETADMVMHDSKDGFLEIDEDDLLLRAIENVL